MANRAGLRAQLRCPATLVLTDAKPLAGMTMDLSRGGVCLLLEEPVPLARVCSVTFRSMLDGLALPVLAMGQVAYCDPVPEAGFRIGVRFISADGASLQAIDQLVSMR
jgi:c-di-GMP-binding flagellar brake protein YcgR